MKTKYLALALIASGLTSAALAGTDTATVAVSASVTGTCKVTRGGTVAFTLDPSSTSDATATVSQQPQFWCTNGTSFTLSDDGGLHNSSGKRLSDGTNFIPYTLSYTTTGSGSGKTTPKTMDISGTVLNANFVNAVAGSGYADTVTVTVTF